jgi:hypothetical protein
MTRTRFHPSGWETGFFRVAATPENGNLQLHRHRVTGVISSLPYDHADRDPQSEWEPIYVYRGHGTWIALKVKELKIIRHALGILLWRQDHKGQPRQETANLLGRITRRLSKGEGE